MPPRKELCRNFMRGSCAYGDRCKFVHAAQQQSKPNAFGFGSQNGSQFQKTNFQQPQQQPNPFGFGVQNNSQPRGANDFGVKQNQPKPFENKWVRTPANANTSSARQPNNQQGAPNHVCTDPETCKRQIVEDFQNEKPLWSLTCYGHQKNGPCDVLGDVSYEELRAAAYDDAKGGLNLQSIVEKERSQIRSKLAEFENLLRNPSSAPSNSAFPAPSNSAFPAPSNSAFPAPSNSAFSAPSNSAFGPPSSNFGVNQNVPNSAQTPPIASSFGQLGTFLNTGQLAPPNNTFQQPNPFGNSSQMPSAPVSNTPPFGNAGSFGNQFGPQPFHSPFSSSSATFNTATVGQTNSSSTSIFPQVSSLGGQSFGNVGLTKLKENAAFVDSVWNKEWKVGEIPEEAPPDEYVF